jgi:hypothetical protein
MTRVQIAAVTVGALVFSVFVVVGGTVSQQAAFLADAGYTAPTHVATCPVRVSPECVVAANDAGHQVRTNDRLRFPVAIRVLSDGGRDVQMPPMNLGIVARCIEVTNWADCALDTPATYPVVAALLGQQLPFSAVGVVKKCVRPKFDAGLTCLRRDADGGAYSFGDRNVMQRTDAVDPLQCEPVECSIVYGDDPESDL